MKKANDNSVETVAVGPVTEVVVITPVYAEPTQMILKFDAMMKEVAEHLLSLGVGLEHFYMSDGAQNLPQKLEGVIVRHEANLGLARTLIDGYKEVLKCRPSADVVVRIDVQEHNPHYIPMIVEAFAHTKTKAMFLPVWYWWGTERPSEREIYGWTNEFWTALAPMDPSRILEIYNQKFPLGYQAFRASFIRELLPQLEKGIEIFKQQNSQDATWGLDLLTMLLAAHMDHEAIDCTFSGYASPWRENRSAEKKKLQAKKAKAMIHVADKLGCKLGTGRILP